MHKRSFLALVSLLFLVSCKQNIPKEYRNISPGVYFHLIKFGDSPHTTSAGDLMTLSLSYSTLNDSLFFSGTRTIRLEDPGFNGSIYQCLLLLGTGDSASFIFDTNDFFIKNLRTTVPGFLNAHPWVKMNVGIINLQKANEFLLEKERFMEWIKEENELNKDLITSFLQEERLPVSPTPSGLYFILLKVGSGGAPLKGDVVTIDYEGKFLDGKYFDSTKSGEPLEFVFGDELMVIRGMEEAIGMMHEGDKAMIIVPSDLAFGSAGAGEGIIPPYTALIYEIELLSVKKQAD